MNKIGAEEFRQKVLDALKKVDSRYEEDLFFTQYRDGYNICYKPLYPASSPGDFNIYMNNTTGRVILYGNLGALVPTVEKYDNFNDFLKFLEAS